MHGIHDRAAEITGVLYRGDAPTKYSRPNAAINDYFTSVVPKE